MFLEHVCIYSVFVSILLGLKQQFQTYGATDELKPLPAESLVGLVTYKGEERYPIFGQTSALYTLSDEGGAILCRTTCFYVALYFLHFLPAYNHEKNQGISIRIFIIAKL